MKGSAALCLVWRLAALVAVLAATMPAGGTLLWSDFGPMLAHDTGDGKNIVWGAVHRDGAARDTLHFKFHVAPISDCPQSATDTPARFICLKVTRP